ncbi:MAG TPA: hydroxyisourate hydrolase, partial [Pedococcus sp.]|nr:hydroxyisourate hydrolase [Pedococcus sp.]
TDGDGRVGSIGPERLAAGEYRLRFASGGYFAAQGVTGFYPEVVVVFTIADAAEHYHVPVLLNPFGYSTYRGT